MKRTMQGRTAHWSDRPHTSEPVTPYMDTPPSPREPRRTAVKTRLGPYEAAYDISLGYNQDRSILLP